MQKEITTAIETLTLVSAEVQRNFADLTEQQLNWKPSPEKWSIAQCLHHLIVSNTTYFTTLQKVASGRHTNSFYQNIKFISRFFGNYLIKETGPVVSKPMKNPPAFAPSQSHLPATIVADFLKHQQQLIPLLEKLHKTDLNKTVISSPALAIITYTLTHLLIILAGHELRHLQQAKRVKDILPK